MRVLGLTGGIGSGKSLVTSMFKQLGAEVIDADQLAREVVEPGQPALGEIAAAFGADVLLPGGQLNRSKLAELIFSDDSARARLNAITHPRIRQRMVEEVRRRERDSGVLVLDIPLLYENARLDQVEAVIVVWVDPQTQLRRLVERDGLSPADARRRIAAQMSLDEKRRRADHVVDNSGSRDATRRQVEAIYFRYASTNGAAATPS
jgi:dephospho-CoA kinase